VRCTNALYKNVSARATHALVVNTAPASYRRTYTSILLARHEPPPSYCLCPLPPPFILSIKLFACSLTLMSYLCVESPASRNAIRACCDARKRDATFKTVRCSVALLPYNNHCVSKPNPPTRTSAPYSLCAFLDIERAVTTHPLSVVGTVSVLKLCTVVFTCNSHGP
jgi:hypothetical protein